MKTPIYSLENKVVGELDLPEAIFNHSLNADLVHQVAVAQAANLRRPWAHAKGRGEVRGGGKKPWKQKHTGRARHGSIRSPIWKGGGVSHGPVKERTYATIVPKKMLRAALLGVLSQRLRTGDLKVIEALPVDILKTKILAQSLKTLLPTLRALLIPTLNNKAIHRASRNMPHLKTLMPNALNLADLLQYKTVLVDREAVAVLSKMS